MNRVRDIVARLQQPDIDQDSLVVFLDRPHDGDVVPGFFNPCSRYPWSSKKHGGKNEIPATHVGFLPQRRSK